MDIEGLAKERLRKAYNCLQLAKNTAEEGIFLNDAANRVYYAIFHAMRAVLALDLFDSKKHSGIIARFNQSYIKTGIFDKKFSDVIQDLSETRNASDYEDFYEVQQHELTEHLANATEFLSVVTEFLEQNFATAN